LDLDLEGLKIMKTLTYSRCFSCEMERRYGGNKFYS